MARWTTLVALLFSMGCGGNKVEDLYRYCDEPEDCEVPEGFSAECLDKSGEGFCTWACDIDGDCADADDEGFEYVCASFESEAGQSCFPSCADPADADNPCPDGFGCRSTGGGSENRKICFPE
ncbi:MAG: hypothetical protein GWP91_03005 [Rhodobacterales bacterium]|nr:hypothetical protein [Rhodobacterales bacterium]